MNSVAQELSGLELEEAIGKSVNIFMPTSIDEAQHAVCVDKYKKKGWLENLKN